MVLERRVVHLDLDLALGPALYLGVVLERGTVQVKRIAFREVLLGVPLVVLTDERHARTRLIIRQALPNAGADGVDELRLDGRRLHSRSSVR